jgi:hypothetical protein
MLWEKVPKEYKSKTCYSDFWEAYQLVIPAEQHHACGKEEGQTNHILNHRRVETQIFNTTAHLLSPNVRQNHLIPKVTP